VYVFNRDPPVSVKKNVFNREKGEEDAAVGIEQD
jgi:hypothetical protein